jgi:hypothetical protein
MFGEGVWSVVVKAVDGEKSGVVRKSAVLASVPVTWNYVGTRHAVTEEGARSVLARLRTSLGVFTQDSRISAYNNIR